MYDTDICLQSEKKYSRTMTKSIHVVASVNRTWILKISKDPDNFILFPSFSKMYSIQTFDFFTLYTTIHPEKKKKKNVKRIKVRVYQSGNQKLKIQRKGQHRVHKTKKNKTKTLSKYLAFKIVSNVTGL